MPEAHLVHLRLLPLERRGVHVVLVDEAVDGAPDLARRGVARSRRAARSRMLNQTSTWLSQEAWVRVKWKWTFRWRASQRSR
jgi:hypothetical protein